MDHIDIPKPKHIVFRPCPICKESMEVELVEIRKQLIEGEIDLKAVTKEWRHICPKCFHETTKYIKTCHHCKIPDDIGKLVRDKFEKIKEKAYYHPECHRKSQVPYVIIALAVVAILAGALLGISIIMKSINQDSQVVAIINEAENLSINPFPIDINEYDLYEKKRAEARASCREAIKINPNYAKAYAVLGQLYLVDGEFEDAAKTFSQGLKVAKNNNEMDLAKDLDAKLKKNRKRI